MRLFANSQKIASILSHVGMKEGEAIESFMLTRQIEGAQRMVEGRNFDIRKQLLDYDKVMNQVLTDEYGVSSYQEWLKETNPELYTWSQSYNPYN